MTVMNGNKGQWAEQGLQESMSCQQSPHDSHQSDQGRRPAFMENGIFTFMMKTCHCNVLLILKFFVSVSRKYFYGKCIDFLLKSTSLNETGTITD